MANKSWRQALSKDDLIHLMESGVYDFAGLKRTLDTQADTRKKDPSGIEPCWECRAIANKLGMRT